MTKSNQPIPAGQDNLIPHLVCDHCSEAIEFYKKAFGAEEVHRMRRRTAAASCMPHYASANRSVRRRRLPEFCGGKSQSPKGLNGTPVSIHHYVTDCDAAIKRAQDAGATVAMPAQDMFWGDRYGVVIDPFGHKWAFARTSNDLTHDQMHAAMKEAFAPKA